MEELKHTLILAIWLAFFSMTQELIARAGFIEVITPSSSSRYRVAVGWWYEILERVFGWYPVISFI